MKVKGVKRNGVKGKGVQVHSQRRGTRWQSCALIFHFLLSLGIMVVVNIVVIAFVISTSLIMIVLYVMIFSKPWKYL